MTERDEVGVYYAYPRDQHERWKAAARHKGQPLKEWIRRALQEAADRDEVQRVEDERRRRSR